MPRNSKTFKTLRARLDAYKSRVHAARDRRYERQKGEWKVVEQLYRSELTTHYGGDESINVNLLYPWIETLLPSLVYNDPNMVAEPLTEEAAKAKKTTEAVVTSELRRCDLSDRLQRIAVDMLLKNCGVLQLGFYGSGLVPDVGASSSGGAEQEDPLAPQGKSKSSDLPFGIELNKLYLLDHRPENFLVDPMCVNGDLTDAAWCGVEYTRRLDQVERDPQYENTKDMQPSLYVPPQYEDFETYQSKTPWANEEDVQHVRLIQLWDKIERAVYTFTMEGDEFHARHDWTLPIEHFPFYTFIGTEDNSEFWAQSPANPWVNLIDELNIVLSSRLSHLKRFARKYIGNKTLLDPEDLEKITLAEDGSITLVDPGDRSLKDVITPLDDAPVPADSYAFTKEIMERAQWISGISELDMGALRAGERPAAEINRVSSGANARRRILGRRISQPLKRLARDVTLVIQKFYTVEDVVKITGDRGETIWLPYTGSDISVENTWRISIEDQAPVTQSERVQRALEKLQIFTPFAQAPMGSGIVDIIPILREVAEEMGMDDLPLLPEAQAQPQDPGYEWYLMVEKDRVLRPHPAEDFEHHLAVHTQQIQEEMQKPQNQRRTAAVQTMANHIEETKGLLQQLMQSQQALAQKGGGQPGGQQPQQPQQGKPPLLPGSVGGQPQGPPGGGGGGPPMGSANNLGGGQGPGAGGPPQLQKMMQALQGGGGQ